jgi:hypothetical protein
MRTSTAAATLFSRALVIGVVHGSEAGAVPAKGAQHADRNEYRDDEWKNVVAMLDTPHVSPADEVSPKLRRQILRRVKTGSRGNCPTRTIRILALSHGGYVSLRRDEADNKR